MRTNDLINMNVCYVPHNLFFFSCSQCVPVMFLWGHLQGFLPVPKLYLKTFLIATRFLSHMVCPKLKLSCMYVANRNRSVRCPSAPISRDKCEHIFSLLFSTELLLRSLQSTIFCSSLFPLPLSLSLVSSSPLLPSAISPLELSALPPLLSPSFCIFHMSLLSLCSHSFCLSYVHDQLVLLVP